MRIKKQVGILLITAVISLNLFPYPALAEQAQSDKTSSIDSITEVMNLLHSFDLSNVSYEDLKNAAIKGMIDSLHDPYTAYYNAADEQKLQDQLHNQKIGIGITFNPDASAPTVEQVIVGSPAEKAGLQSGDTLLSIDGTQLNGNDGVQALIHYLNGKKIGDHVSIVISRSGKMLTIPIQLELFTYPAVIEKWLSGGIGYIRLLQFSQDAGQQFDSALKQLKDKGLNSLVIDLRDNGGGYLTEVQHIAGDLMAKGTLLISKDKDGNITKPSFEGTSRVSVPVVILVNAHSASASEVLAGAMQDYRRANIVGTTTFGKGIYQQMFPLLTAGGLLKITTDEYLTPSGHKVNGIGIHPDVNVPESGQLITALRLAGLHHMQVTFKGHHVTVNQTEFIENFELLNKDGKTYAPSRLLSALIDGKAEWQADSHFVKITNSAGSAEYSDSHGMLLQNGVSYVDLNTFTHDFNTVSWKSTGDQTIIEVTQ